LREFHTGGPVCLKKETWFCHCEEAFFADEAIPLTWRGDCFGVKSTPRNDSEFLGSPEGAKQSPSCGVEIASQKSLAMTRRLSSCHLRCYRMVDDQAVWFADQ
jgi:hypothetical protein